MLSILKTDYRIHTKYSPEECRSILEENLGSVWDPLCSEAFAGRIAGSTFKIVPRQIGRNAFRPTLHGKMRASSGGGSVIRVQARPSPFVLVFSAVWLAMACIFLGVGIYIFAQGESFLLMGIALVFLLVYISVAAVAFRLSERASRRTLHALFET